MRSVPGKRVTLRSLRPADAVDIFLYASDPEVTRFVGWRPHRSPLDSLEYINCCTEPSPDLFTFAVEYLPHQRVIGTVDLRLLSRMRRVGEIGYTIARPYWGQGFNVEAGSLLLDFAFGDLALRRVTAVCDVENRRSYRTMEKLGMTLETVIKGATNRSESSGDRYQYSMLQHEWRRLRGGVPALPARAGHREGSSIRLG